MSRISTIPSDLCFVTSLARGLWSRAEKDPLRLAETTVFLPTRRACRHLREAFLRVTGARAALLPRMQPFGDLDEAELDFASGLDLFGLPPAIAPLRRQMLLTKLILAKDSSLPLDQAASLASSLAALLDQVQIEELDFANLTKLAPDKYAQHWQETLTFLEIITAHWPAVLAAEGCMDPAARRAKLIDGQIEAWKAVPPSGPMIAAGSTGSVPAVGRLMKAIAALPQGEVVLPGLDLSLDEEAWQAADETHPQFTMKHWLEISGFKRSDILLWQGVETQNAPRLSLLAQAMRPPQVTESWRHLSEQEIPASAMQGIKRLDLDHQREEADVIALRLRAALEEEGATAALITPDRALAARVASSLERWGITANDSAGQPLDVMPVGSFLCALLHAATPNASPVEYLSLLKHPLAAVGIEPLACRQAAREIEVRIWRGVRLVNGWRGAADAVRTENGDLAAWLDKIADSFAPLTDSWRAEKPIAEWIDAHLALADRMAETENEERTSRLWRGEAGEAAVLWLNEWRQAAGDFEPVTAASYARLFECMIGGVMVRPSYGQHPRLSILGPLEARLLHHDLVILGGLNEGVWPPASPIDPWLSRPMKKDFGLPLPERRVGLSAHDFVQLAAGSQVMLTRAVRVGGSPTVPSRFLAQVETVLRAAGHGAGDQNLLAPALPWRDWAREMDQPAAQQPMLPPAPCPPVEVRPRRLSVTEIGTWLCNPYAIYAKHILKLKKLDPIDTDIGASDHGQIIHAALENFLRQTMEEWPADPLALLLEEGRKAFDPYADRPQIKAFWGPRFEVIAAWFVEQEKLRHALGIKPLAVEAKGKMEFQKSSFTLTGRADRIDEMPEGGVEIIDYKTGSLPTVKKVMTGYEPQLALLGMMAAAGAFDNLLPYDAVRLSYWKLQGSAAGEEIKTYDKDLSLQIDKARTGLLQLIEAFGDERTAYHAVPKPHHTPNYDDYAHLARLAEWGREMEEGE